MIDIATTTIRDLQNARQVLHHAGHFQGGYISPGTGSVCLDGALRVATTCTIIQTPIGLFTASFFKAYQLAPVDRLDQPDAYERLDAAINALAQVLPENCPADHSALGVHDFDDAAGDSSRSRVWHFNDHVCDGAREADLVLEQAIQKLQANL